MLTAEQRGYIAELRSKRISWKIIGPMLGIGEYKIRCELEAGYRERLRKNTVRRRAGKASRRFITPSPKPSDAVGHISSAVRIPAHVIADREARLAAEPRSLTALLMGDPPPGRSALDKRRVRLVVSNSL